MSETRLAEVARPAFARHETFAPRFGWLRKAFEAVEENREVFLQNDAPVTLGVGKNMVNAIRYWAYAFKLTVEHPKGGTSRAFTASPTWEACWLFHEHGADPYLEDTASLWLLHWWLLSPPCYAPTWWVAFHALPTSRFSENELADLVARHVRLAGWEAPVSASISKDVDCLTKMYAPRKTPTGSPGSFEDLLDCPFRELGLLEAVPGQARTWRFTSAARASLPSRVIAYACLDYASRHDHASGSVALARLANELGGPGRAFRIREPEIASALEEVSSQHDGITVTDAVGQRSLAFHRAPKELAWEILDAHYGAAALRVPSRADWLAVHPELAAELARRGLGTPEELALAEEIA
ncbi:DUF4007 domain-containing protein [Carbonactinospora thermoautotrophica]|uniref:DUF4007 family protein n=1 Tax=Carbonactinospora thermoautotrophica TaxID=1469144 RepID=UPI00226F19BE|nr:DUF4007 family protein [Carbonactinospora thermoautotrophica]MCX9193852.1 DUF4007 domain-containing protein [Carbonactinospora thermoautotrophica]